IRDELRARDRLPRSLRRALPLRLPRLERRGVVEADDERTAADAAQFGEHAASVVGREVMQQTDARPAGERAVRERQRRRVAKDERRVDAELPRLREHRGAAVETDDAALRRERRGEASGAAGRVELTSNVEPRDEAFERATFASFARGRKPR